MVIIPLVAAPEDASTRGKILEVALETLENQGESAIRVHDIAHSCGVTATTLYRYFGSREGLIAEAQVEQCRRLLTITDFAFAEQVGSINSREEFRAFVDLMIDHFLTHPDRIRGRRVRTFALASTAGRPELAERISDMVTRSWDVSINAFQRAKDSGWTRPDFDPVAALAWFSAVTDGRVRYELVEDAPFLEGLNKLTKQTIWFVLFGETI